MGTYIIEITDAYNCEYQVVEIVLFNLENPDTDGDGICDNDEVFGCTDPDACNYNFNSDGLNCEDGDGNIIDCTEDDNSCIYAIGCDYCSGATNGTGFVVNNDVSRV